MFTRLAEKHESPKIIMLTSMWPGQTHHMIFSGYHQLIRYITLPKIVIYPWRGRISAFPTLIINKLLHKPLRNFISEFYSLDYTSLELKLFFSDASVIHHLYGEDTWCLSAYMKPRDKRVIVTFHQPPLYFVRFIPSYLLKKLNKVDHIIVLSTSQYHFFSRLVKDVPISFIPHGVDVKKFTPSSQIRRNCLIVGHWLRDFSTIIRVIKALRDRKDITFDVVLPRATPAIVRRAFHTLRSRIKNLNVYYNIDDLSLKRLYSTSSIFLLSTKDFTASNALLEAMASALSIIAVDVGGIRDYLDDQCAILVKRDVKEIISSITYLIEDENTRRDLGKKARMKAYSFSWERLAPRYEEIYLK